MTTKWIMRFMHMATRIASWSKDPSTKVGAIAVDASNQLLAEGYNGLPRGIADHFERMQPPDKYLWTVHAEANLVAHAARRVLAGSTVFVTHCCCAPCAALLIQAGVTHIVIGKSCTTNMDKHTFEVALQMLLEAGVTYEIREDYDENS